MESSKVEVVARTRVGDRPHAPWWVTYDPGRPCPERDLERRLQAFDERLRIRWHRAKACWCVTRDRRKPGRMDEDLVLAWQDRATGERKPLCDKLIVEVRSMDTYRWGGDPFAAWERRAKLAEERNDRRLARKWADRDNEAAKAFYNLFTGRVVG